MGGGLLDLANSLAWKLSHPPSPFLENELDLDELLGDQRRRKGIATTNFVIIFVLKQRDVPPN